MMTMFRSKPIVRDLALAAGWLLIFIVCTAGAVAGAAGFILRLLDLLPWLLHGNP